MEKKQKSKDVKLRAFRIENSDMSKPNSGLLNMLLNKLSGSIVQDRRMLLNEDDPHKEEDLISYYDDKLTHLFFGTLLRISSADGIPNITEDLLHQKEITINDLDNINIKSTILYKSHYYFALNNDFLVTNLSFPKKINNLQTYINHLLRDVRGTTLYQFTPMISEPPSTKLSDLKSIKLQDSTIAIPNENKKKDDSQSFTKKFSNLKKELINKFLNDVEFADDLVNKNIVSADLFLKFAKPKEMTKADYEKFMGAVLKPIDDDSVTFITKKDQKIKARDFIKQKIVEIEATESGKISEPRLSEAMEEYLNELKNEENC
jgi:hypothetical protein